MNENSQFDKMFDLDVVEVAHVAESDETELYVTFGGGCVTTI